MRENMRKTLAPAVLLCTLAAVILLSGAPAQAAVLMRSFYGGDLDSFTVGRFDITGDSKKDKITVKQTFTGEEELVTKIVVYINGKKKLTVNKSALPDVFNCTYVLAKMSDTQSYLQIVGHSVDDWNSFNRIYYYNRTNGKLVLACKPSSLYGSAGTISMVTENTLTVGFHAQPREIGGINYEMEYKRSGKKLKLKSQNVKAQSSIYLFQFPDLEGEEKENEDMLNAQFEKNMFTAMKDLTFYKSYSGANASVKAFSVEDGEMVILKQVRVTSTGIWGQFSDYDDLYTGWIQLDRDLGEYTWNEDPKLNPGVWFYGVSRRLAG